MSSNRRKFFKTLGIGAAGLTIGTTTISFASEKSTSNKKENEDGQVLLIGDNIAVTNTQYGKVRGYVLRGINYFLGIPYGADTSGANRFMPPQKPKPWTDIFQAIWWGNAAPQIPDNMYKDKYMAFRDHWNYDDISEDCLKINIFTPGINDGKKRPVLLWMHGGGFWNGNAIEHDGYNGENLARLGNIVFCSVNHRLGPLGFADFSTVGDEKYRSSGNVGMLDLVAALEWIRDNIANFGGDPENITIVGQSGGGSKVCTITSMPSAKGLFGKAIVLSGANAKVLEKEQGQKLGAYILKEAGLTALEVDKLQQMPWRDYYELAYNAAKKFAKEVGMNPENARQLFRPHVDGKNIPQHPFYPEASPTAANIPMLICSCLNEIAFFNNPSLETISFQGVKEKLSVTYGSEKAEEIVNAYAKNFPTKKPVEIWSMAEPNRQRTVAVADVKSKQSPPVYTAWYGWQSPMFDNRLRSFHTSDICQWFYNTDLMLSHTGGGARPRALSKKMAGSLLQFMKAGDPNGGGLPNWPKYTPEKGELMFLDDICEVQFDPDREARKTLPPL